MSPQDEAVNETLMPQTLEQLLRRWRWPGIAASGVAYVFLPGSSNNLAHWAVLLAGSVVLWFPLVLSVVRGFRAGLDEED